MAGMTKIVAITCLPTDPDIMTQQALTMEMRRWQFWFWRQSQRGQSYHPAAHLLLLQRNIQELIID